MDLLTFLLARHNTVHLVNGKVPAEVLPSYVDDVIEGFFNPTDFQFYAKKTHPISGEPVYSEPIEGELGKIYIDEDSGYTYRYGIATQKFIQIGGPDYLNQKPDGEHYLIGSDQKITAHYNTQYVVRFGILTTAKDFNYSRNEQVFEKLDANGASEENDRCLLPVDVLSLIPCGRDENQSYTQKAALPCIYYNSQEYGFLSYEDRKIYIVPRHRSTQATDGGYRIIDLYDTSFPANAQGGSQNPLTADALAAWFYQSLEDQQTHQVIYSNVVEKIIRETFLNTDLLKTITSQEITYLRSLEQVLPLEAIPSRLNAENQIVDMATLIDKLSWKTIQTSNNGGN